MRSSEAITEGYLILGVPLARGAVQHGAAPDEIVLVQYPIGVQARPPGPVLNASLRRIVLLAGLDLEPEQPPHGARERSRPVDAASKRAVELGIPEIRAQA